MEQKAGARFSGRRRSIQGRAKSRGSCLRTAGARIRDSLIVDFPNQCRHLRSKLQLQKKTKSKNHSGGRPGPHAGGYPGVVFRPRATATGRGRCRCAACNPSLAVAKTNPVRRNGRDGDTDRKGRKSPPPVFGGMSILGLFHAYPNRNHANRPPPKYIPSNQAQRRHFTI